MAYYTSLFTSPHPKPKGRRRKTRPIRHFITTTIHLTHNTTMSLRLDVRNMLREYDADPSNAGIPRHVVRTEMALMVLRHLFSTRGPIPNSDFAVLGELVREKDIAMYCYYHQNQWPLVIDVFKRAFEAVQQDYVEQYPHFNLGSPLQELQGWAELVKITGGHLNSREIQDAMDVIIYP